MSRRKVVCRVCDAELVFLARQESWAHPAEAIRSPWEPASGGGHPAQPMPKAKR